MDLKKLLHPDNLKDDASESPNEDTLVITLTSGKRVYRLTFSSLQNFTLTDSKRKTIDHTGYEVEILDLVRDYMFPEGIPTSMLDFMKERNLPFGYIRKIAFFMDELASTITRNELLSYNDPPLDNERKLVTSLSVALELLAEKYQR
jgi:hypothetical protein